VSSILTFISRSGVKEDHTASYFSHNNTEATRLREQLAADSLEMLIQWLRDGGNVGIHGGSRIHPHMISILHSQPDATNSTKERRYRPVLSPIIPHLTVLPTGLILNNGLQSRKE
jgi:hypothetical protein